MVLIKFASLKCLCSSFNFLDSTAVSDGHCFDNAETNGQRLQCVKLSPFAVFQILGTPAYHHSLTYTRTADILSNLPTWTTTDRVWLSLRATSLTIPGNRYGGH